MCLPGQDKVGTWASSSRTGQLQNLLEKEQDQDEEKEGKTQGGSTALHTLQSYITQPALVHMAPASGKSLVFRRERRAGWLFQLRLLRSMYR